MKGRLILLVWVGLMMGWGGDLWGQQGMDEVSGRMIREFTTRGDFLSPLVDHIPESATVPSVRDFLGYVAGAPKKLTYARDIHRYFYELARTSERIKVYETGKSNEGRARILAVIADEATLGRLDQYQANMKRLADPRGVSEEEAQRLIETTKPTYMLTGGLHSPETGSPEVLMELAYRLIVSEDEKMKSIRENMVTLIIPVLEVDGREKLVDWYYRHTIEHTDWEDMPPTSPPYWGSYTLHDNNREGIQVSQPLTQQMYNVFFKYLPVVSLDLHESVPLLYISMGTGPYNPNIDPVSITEFQLLAQYEVSELVKYGMPGVWTWGFYTGWYPGYLLWITNNHNTTGRFYETWGNAGANTFRRKVTGNYANKDIMTRQWYRPVPPPEKVLDWSFRNNINFMQSGVISGLYYVSQNGGQFLENFWAKSKNAINKGKNEAPYAFIIPRNQQNKYMEEYLINQLDKHGIEVHSLSMGVSYGEKEYPVGTWVVRLDQPYGPLAKNLLEKQEFPKDADYRPYDDVAWTLGLQYGLETVQVDGDFILDERMTKVGFPHKVEAEFPAYTSGENYFIVPNHGSPSLISLRYAFQDIEMFAAEKSFVIKDQSCPAGSLIIPAGQGFRNRLERAAEAYCLDVISTDTQPAAARHLVELPRIGVYHSWVYTQDSGWFRFTLEQYGVEYTLINDDVLREGGLKDKFDVIIIPELGRGSEVSTFIHSVDDKWSPLAYTKTEEFSSHGRIDSTDDMTRGMGFAGLAHLEEFVDEGGVVVALGGGSGPVVELGLAPGVSRVNPASVNVVNPGSFVKTKILQANSPIVYGYEQETHVFTGVGPIFNVDFKDRGLILMQYGTSEAKDYPEENKKDEDICLSGMVQETGQLVQSPAILNVPRKDGRIIIFNFNPAHRHLNHHDFGFLFNTIMHWSELGAKN